MRTMYDDVDAANIPADATLMAGYVDGSWPSYNAMKARFPHATVVPIAVSWRTNAGTVLDCEKGDATPSECPSWVVMRRARGVDPTIYCNSDTWPAVRQAFQGAHIPEPHYWIAQWDDQPTIPAGAVAKQYKNGSTYDTSVVAAYWPGVDPIPTPPEDTLPTPYDVWAYSHGDHPDVHQTLNNAANQAAAAAAGITAVDSRLTAIESELGAISATLAKLAPPTPKAAALEAPQDTPVGTPVANEAQAVEFVPQEPTQAAPEDSGAVPPAAE